MCELKSPTWDVIAETVIGGRPQYPALLTVVFRGGIAQLAVQKSRSCAPQ